MKKLFLTVTSLFFFIITYGQKTELSVSLNSGLFSFAGESSAPTSFINFNDQINSGYTNNPYGSKNGICYGLSGNIKRVSTQNFIFGLDLGYEMLRSKVSINKISGFTGTSTYEYDASGQTFLNTDFINLNPFIGYRIPVKQVNVDVTGGLDFGYNLRTHENGDATAINGTKYETSADRRTIKWDIRPRVQISASYKKLGVYIGYSFGLSNYVNDYNEGTDYYEGTNHEGTNEAYSRIFRFGMTYQIK
jgi:hypothetical protein